MSERGEPTWRAASGESAASRCMKASAATSSSPTPRRSSRSSSGPACRVVSKEFALFCKTLAKEGWCGSMEAAVLILKPSFVKG